ncbi:MAG TPA: hypothetical protein VH475_03950 [Tepidisphaeraceae bacterium]|jgi:hypothetical protein
MAELSTESAERIAITANRLRAVQADFADQPLDLRRRYLGEEVKRALSMVEPQARPAFLDELRRRFPAWNGEVELSDVHAAAAAAAGQDQQANNDSASARLLAAQLLDRARRLTPEERQELAVQLGQGGLVLVLEPQWDPEALNALHATLQTRAGEALDPNRLLDLVRILTFFTCSLHQLTWSTWRAIAPYSVIRRAGNLQKLLSRYVAGDATVPTEQVQGDVDRLRQLVASLISAISQVGRQFATSQLSRLAPSEIESAVAAESASGSWWSSGKRDSRCWQKYVELAETALDQVAIEAEIRKVIVEHAEQLMKKLGHVEKA